MPAPAPRPACPSTGVAALHYRLGRTLAWWGWPGGALLAYRDALAVEPGYADAHLALGETLGRRGQWLDASRAFREAARLRPTCVEAQGNLVLALGRARLWDAADGALRRLIRLRPGDADLHVLRGALLLKLGSREEAIRAFRWAVQLPPSSHGPRSLLGAALLGAEAWADLIGSYRGAAGVVGGRTPDRARGRFARLVKVPVEPAARQGRALLSRFWLLVGRLQALLRRSPVAIRSLRRAHAFARGAASASLVLLFAPLAVDGAVRTESPQAREAARICLQSGPREGVADCRQAIALGLAPGRSALVHRVLAWKLETLKDWAAATETYRALVALDPRDSDARFRLATVLHYGQDRPAEAEAELREALALRPTDAETHGLLGVVLNAQARFAESSAALEEAQRLDAHYLARRPASRVVLEASRRGEHWP